MYKRILLSCSFLCVVLFLSWDVAHAKSSLTLDSVRVGSHFTAIDGDDGRFREDNYTTDDYSGGLEELLMSGKL